MPVNLQDSTANSKNEKLNLVSGFRKHFKGFVNFSVIVWPDAPTVFRNLPLSLGDESNSFSLQIFLVLNQPETVFSFYYQHKSR